MDHMKCRIILIRYIAVSFYPCLSDLICQDVRVLQDEGGDRA